jgi:hypothetical protein
MRGYVKRKGYQWVLDLGASQRPQLMNAFKER